MLALWAVGAWLGPVGLAPGAASAQRCDRTDDLEVAPANGATRVALDAPIKIRYPAKADQLERLWALFDAGEALIQLIDLGEDAEDTPREVAGTLAPGGERVLFFQPTSELEATHTYLAKVFAPELSGVGYRDFRFETGLRVDSGPPTFTVDEGSVTLVTREAPPECDAPPGSLAVGLSFDPADDDSDLSAVEHYGFLTHAEGLSAPRLLARWRSGGQSASLDFLLSAEETSAPVCVTLRAVDGVGNVAEDEPEICFDPIQGSFFRPLCSVAAGPGAGAPRGAAAGLCFLVWSALALRAMRRRRRGSARRLRRLAGRPEDSA